MSIQLVRRRLASMAIISEKRRMSGVISSGFFVCPKGLIPQSGMEMTKMRLLRSPTRSMAFQRVARTSLHIASGLQPRYWLFTPIMMVTMS